MKSYSKIIITIVILLLPLSCRKKWNEKGLGQFIIKRQESYNYSEMLSGDLDSTKKKGLEEYKKSISEEKKNKPNDENTNKSKNNTIKEKLNFFLVALKNLYNNIIEMFN